MSEICGYLKKPKAAFKRSLLAYKMFIEFSGGYTSKRFTGV